MKSTIMAAGMTSVLPLALESSLVDQARRRRGDGRRRIMNLKVIEKNERNEVGMGLQGNFM